MRGYVATLLAELRFWHARLKRTGQAYTVDTIFWGGGTPSLLEPAWIAQMLDEIGNLFAVSADTEISMEANPDSLHTPERAYAFLAAGINRVSLGVQTLDNGQLRVLGRAHRAEDAIQAVSALRAAGCANVNIDLIWGLPGQTAEQWLDMLQAVVRLHPEHISAYGLTLEPGTPLAAAGITLPDEETLASMFMDCGTILEQAGWLQYEISNYAREGFHCRHNLGYWEGKEYLGLGPAATSRLGNMRWTNPVTVEAWISQVAAGVTSQNCETLSAFTMGLESMMLRLRTCDGLPVHLYREFMGRDFLADHGPFVQELIRHGLARLAPQKDVVHFSLTRKGMLVSDTVLENLFAAAHTCSGC